MFYVYTHNIADRVLYVGVGVGVKNRAFDIGNRSKTWKDTFSGVTFDVIIVEKELTREEALKLKGAAVKYKNSVVTEEFNNKGNK